MLKKNKNYDLANIRIHDVKLIKLGIGRKNMYLPFCNVTYRLR